MKPPTSWFAGNRAGRAIAVLGLTAVLLVISLTAAVAYLLEQSERNARRATALATNTELIRYHREVLTSSASLAAASGNLALIDRHEQATRDYETLLDETKRMLEPLGRANDLAPVITASLPLLRSDTIALEMVRAGNRSGAVAKLSGPEYDADRKAFATALSTTLAALRQDRDRELNRVAGLRRQAAGAGLVGLVILALAWTIAQRTATRWWNDREKARREFAEVSARNALILDTAGEGIYGVDAAGRVTVVNPAALALTGHQEDELLGQDSHDVLHHSRPDGSVFPREECAVFTSLTSGMPARSVPDVYWRRDGTPFPVELTVTPTREDGQVGGAVVVLRDVSEQRAVEKMKDEFVSVVSHELRTPLTSIRGSLGLLASGSLGELSAPAARMLEIAASNTDRLVRLINDILDIERIESGQVRLELARVPAGRLVLQAVEGLRGIAAGGDVTVTSSAEDVDVRADQDRIVQTLTNLIGNAVKFSPRGGQVAVSVRREGADAVFSVRDEGRGVPPEKLDSIFERFQQVDASDARQKGGTGLGLAISRSIVEQHGGRIWVDSEPGVGSTFSFTVPAMEAVRVPAGEGSGRVVLVVDDDQAALDRVSQMLSRHGYQPLQAGSGQSALRQAAARMPAAVVLDLVMPGTTGWDVLAQLRAAPATARLPVVILSRLREGRDAGEPGRYDAWLRKPVDETELLAALDRALRSDADRPTKQVVLVEDDLDLSSVLAATLERHGLVVHVTDSAETARHLVSQVQPDLVVADVHLGRDGDGIALLGRLREAGLLDGLPVLVYTAADLDAEQLTRLAAVNALVLTKSRVPPEEFEARVLQLLGVGAAGATPPP